MKSLNLNNVYTYVEKHIDIFHGKRISSLEKLELRKVLRRKNPYLFRTKHILTAEQIIRGLVDAHISSNEETLFGDWLEGLAIFINHEVYGGRKSGIPGVDLEFDHEDRRYIVNIKSGPNWGNSSQIKKMISDFNTARKILRTSNAQTQVIAVNGCCYGRDTRPDKGEYFKYCGQRFWEFISADPDLYTRLIEPLGHKAREKNEQFMEAYAHMINRFVVEFSRDFCTERGAINWDALVRFNSSAQ